ncbi:hypothetical protein [Enhygromyxa salina]|uniref:Baseplate protein J-like domain-containing protein n=1 Tax=Enhygromyxa salina TaxID=215803 RepID=A0A2S9XIG7_9BACT|nr:hypothetical protein [Enhygromyxa salina]PRP92665.1 hypothetical protein ENSA7_81540 [Enhygromyxa salina]
MTEDRLTLLCAQTVLTGIDFIAVDDPALQTVLNVYFLIDPLAGLDPDFNEDLNLDLSIMRIWAPSGGRKVVEPKILSANWVDDGALPTPRTYLQITVDQPGDFSLYRFSIDHAQVDYHFSRVDFSFKQACPTTLDCKPRPTDDSCPQPADPLQLNPLARDFVSLRQALLDYTSQKYPSWTHRSQADVGVMMLEVMAAIGDEFNYIKDRFTREGVLDELSQRRSLRQLLRLLDYEVHDGRSPSTVLELDVADGESDDELEVLAGTRVWAHRLGESPITFELGEGIADYRTKPLGDPRSFTVKKAWNTIAVHEPDGAKPTLAKGTTQLFLIGWMAPESSWVTQQRTLVLHEDPTDGSTPKRHLVHVTEYEQMTDELADLVDGSVTRVAWSKSEALPCAMVIANMSVKGNVVPATAGESFEEFFSVRGDGTLTDVVERQGPLDNQANTRNPLFRYSPAACEALRLGWLGALASSSPEVELQAVNADQDSTWDLERQWTWRRTLLDSTSNDEHFTIEDGTWRRTVGYRMPDGSELVHRDWAANAGYTLRFGDGEFGLVPAEQTIFRLRYRSGPGASANVNAGTIVHLVHPVDGGLADDTRLSAVSNPFDLVDGLEPEDMQRAKFLGPDAFRHDTFSAVTPADYQRLAETLDWVQQANATFRWTGSWLTIFVAVDPIGTFEITRAQQSELEDLMDCVRQIGRDVHVIKPDYIDLDVKVRVCMQPGYYAGQVEAAVLEALTGPGGFFSADKFSFGTPLRRSPLVARIQSIAGVRAVTQIRLRAREKTGEFEFADSEFEVGAGQIVRVVNDPTLPEQGTVIVSVGEVV